MIGIPFTYKLIFKPTGQYYYGVRYAKNCNPSDLWTTYFTSSKLVKTLINEFGKDSFKYKITNTFADKKEALVYEQKLLKKVNAPNNIKFLNMAITEFGYKNFGYSPIHNIQTDVEMMYNSDLPLPNGWLPGFSLKHRLSFSKVRKGKTAWNKGKQCKSTGPCTNERKKNISKSRLKTNKIKCEYCFIECDPGNFKQFHGEKCKHNPNISNEIILKRSNQAKLSMIKQKQNGTYSAPKQPIGKFKCPHCNKIGINYGAMHRHHFTHCPMKDKSDDTLLQT